MRRVRDVNILSSAAEFEHRDNGCWYVRSSHPLGPYPAKITQRLEHWAEHSGERTFLARRGAGGEWNRITYAQTLTRVRTIAQGLIDRRLSSERPIAILSGNSLDHALLALAALYTGTLYAPIAPSYSLAAKDFSTLRNLWQSLRPGLVLAEGTVFGPALESVDTKDVEIVSSCAAIKNGTPSAAVDEAHAMVGPDTVAKVLFTSGSTGRPKGVLNTQRMWCSNLEMIRSVLRFLGDEPPVLCDWLPWNHTFGGNHNFGIVLYNGGTLYIDDGKPTLKAFAATVANLREVPTTAYFNVPKGYELLVPALRADAELRRTFFSRLQIVFYAAAGLKQQVWDDLQDIAYEECGEEILMVTGLGCTETAPSSLFTRKEGASAGRIGLPVPGVEVKLAPLEHKTEIRVKGPNVTPGFWRNPELTQASFDEEGFYNMGDAVSFVDPDDPLKGFVFEGRITEDFKLSSGTWVSVGPLRARFLTCFGDAAQDVVIAGPDRDFVTALMFPQRPCEQDQLRRMLNELAAQSTGNSTRIVRLLVLDQPPSPDAGEITDKGTINQKAVMKNRAPLVEELYAPKLSGRTIEIAPEYNR